MLRSLRSALAILATLAPLAHPQLVVRVEANGAAVYGAEVAVWSDSGRLALGRTDAAGIVRFPVSLDKVPIQSITARRVGFSPARLTSPAADSVTLWLTKGAADLASVAVKSRPLQCPAESERDAVALWQRAAARYTAGQDTVPFSALGSSAEETVTAQDRGFGDPPSRRFLGYLPAGKFGSPNEYLFGTYHPPIGPAFERWTYPSMVGSRAGRFASAEFGEQHTFVVLSRSGEATTLGFCARNRSGPDIDGEIDVGADTLLVAARWTFRVPHHQEEVGGEATFGVAHLDGARYLIAVTTSSWREMRPGLYDQKRTVLEAWKFGHTSEQAWLGSWSTSGDRSGTARPQGTP
jgi:hypothetical protein